MLVSPLHAREDSGGVDLDARESLHARMLFSKKNLPLLAAAATCTPPTAPPVPPPWWAGARGAVD